MIETIINAHLYTIFQHQGLPILKKIENKTPINQNEIKKFMPFLYAETKYIV